MVNERTVGFIFAIVGVVFNGSFAVLFKKIEDVVDTDTFMVWFGFGACLIWILTIPLLPVNQPRTDSHDHFIPSWCGLSVVVGFVLASAFYFVFGAVRKLGVASAQGVAASVNIITSFFIGVLLFGETIVSLANAVCGLMFLLVGVVVISGSKALLSAEPLEDIPTVELCCDDGTTTEEVDHTEHQDREDGSLQLSNAHSGSKVTMGLVYCLIAGVVGASAFAPSNFEHNEECHGFAYMPSAAVGFSLCTLLVKMVRAVLGCAKGGGVGCVAGGAKTNLYKVVSVSILAGAIFGTAIFCLVNSIGRIGYAVAGPLFQTSIVVEGLWGTFVLGELKGRRVIGLFCVGAVVVLVGAGLLPDSTGPPR